MGNAKVKAQVTIELTLSLILLLVFLVATVKIFVWLGNGIVKRHWDYEESRTEAGQADTNDLYRYRTTIYGTYDADETQNAINAMIKFHEPDRLNIFSNW